MRAAVATLFLLIAPAVAAERHTIKSAPPALKALIEANKDKPGVDEGCGILSDAKPEDVVLIMHRLDSTRRLIIIECERTMKFNVQRALIVTGDGFASAQRAQLPVRKSAHPKGITSDSMDMTFDEKTAQLKSNAWEGANCWSQRIWIWQKNQFVRLTDTQNGMCR